MRIVSVCPSNTDLMAHLGLLEWVVGRDSWSDWPEGKVDKIPLIGSVLNIDIARVIALKPDLILASNNVPGMDKVVPKLIETGLPIVIYDPETWQNVLDNITDLAERLNVSERAHNVIERAHEEIDELKAASEQLHWINLIVEWWPDPIIIPKRDTYVNEILSWVKVINPFQKLPGRSGVITHQDIIGVKPELYAISWCGTPFSEYDTTSVYNRFAHQPVQFIQQPNRVFKLWEGIIGHPSLRLIDGAKTVLAHRMTLNI